MSIPYIQEAQGQIKHVKWGFVNTKELNKISRDENYND